MLWSSEPGAIVSDEDAMGNSGVSVVEVVEEVWGVGILGVQFPSPKDIKMIQMMRKREKGRDIL
jgi:hypothetical protein